MREDHWNFVWISFTEFCLFLFPHTIYWTKRIHIGSDFLFGYINQLYFWIFPLSCFAMDVLREFLESFTTCGVACISSAKVRHYIRWSHLSGGRELTNWCQLMAILKVRFLGHPVIRDIFNRFKHLKGLLGPCLGDVTCFLPKEVKRRSVEALCW